MLSRAKWILISFLCIAFLIGGNSVEASAPGPTISILSPAEGKTVWSDGTASYPVRIVFKAWDSDTVDAGTFSLSVDGGAYNVITIQDYGVSGVYYSDWQPLSGSKVYTLRIRGDDVTAETGYSREVNVTVKIGTVSLSGVFPGDGKLLIRDNDNNICMSCHGLKSHSSASLESTKYGNWERVCRDCHTPHNTPNIFLLQTSFRIFTGINQNYAYNRKVDFRNISGESTYGFVTKTGNTRRGPCEVCHTRTSNADTTPRWRNWTSQSDIDGDKHNAGLACINCHPHKDGFRVNCNACHGTPPFNNFSGPDGYAAYKGNSYLSSGVFLDESQTPHYKHAVVYPFGNQGVGYGTGGRCRACHSNSSNLHMNTVYQNVNFGLHSTTGDGRNYDTGTRECNNVYCHSNGGPWNGSTYDAPTYNPPTWGAPGSLPGTWQCNSCHNYPPTTNRHETHAGPVYNLDCQNCHGATVNNYSTIVDTTMHVNKNKDIVFDARAITGGANPSYDPVAHRCSNVYCHGNFVNGNNTSIQWNGASPCGSCHEVPNTATSHDKHVTIYQLDCANCHESTMDAGDNYNIASYATHVDGTKTIEFGLARTALIDNTGGTGTGNPTQCSNIYCHSRGTDQIAPFDDPASAPNMTPTWGDLIGCNYCHGNDDYWDYRAAMPNYSGGNPKGNSHQKHVVTNGIECINCHSVTLASNYTIGNHTTHVNMEYNIDVVPTYDFGGAYYDPAQHNCDNVLCHGGNPTRPWGDTADCRDCHGNDHDVDNYAQWTNFTGIVAQIYTSDFNMRGHGRTSGNYAMTENVAANKICTDCHDSSAPHGGADRPFRTKWTGTLDDFCLSCHGSGAQLQGAFSSMTGIRTHSFAGIQSGGGLQNHTSWRITPKCIDCHDPHGDGNVAMIHDKVHSGGSDDKGRRNPFFNKSTVVFLSHSGGNSFANSSNTSICQACHTRTNHFRQEGYGGASDQLHMNVGGTEGKRCTPSCHNHRGGFAHGYSGGGGAGGTGCVYCHGHEAGTEIDTDMSYPWTSGSGVASLGKGTTTPHSTHTESIIPGTAGDDDRRGPGIYCNVCHDINNIPRFKSGTDSNGDGMFDLSETDVCDSCHSPAGSFDGVNDAVIGAKNNWHTGGVYNNGTSLKAGKEQWCIGCHDENPAQVFTIFDNITTYNNYTSFETAPNKAGDNATYGFYITGHGKAAGNYTTLSWQDTTATGNPAANRNCDNCHDTTKQHIDSGVNPPGKRLRIGYENDENNTVCENCHKSGGVATADPVWFTNVSAFENSAHGRNAIMNPYTSRPIFCTDCHDVHGTVNRAMTTANQETLCFSCHTNGFVHNTAISGAAVADDIQEAFSYGNKHDIGNPFNLNGRDYKLECISCHNVHIITGKYWQHDQGRSPVTRFSNMTAVWGDDSNEKMNTYGGTYRTPNSDPFSGDQLPNYPAFCLDCHATMTEPGGHGGINWSGDPHGLQSANVPNGGGTCPDWYTCGKAEGWSNDDCVASDPNSCWPVMTRGKGEQVWSRGPFNQEDRIGGANFALSCTDCHEAHGSGNSSMIRTNPNGGTGSVTWNVMCNNCHYYYSTWHAGMSCGNASCHVQNSIHRMDNKSGAGGTRTFDPDLVLHLAFEGNLNDSGDWNMHSKWMDSISGSFTTGKSGQAITLSGGNNVQVGTRNSSWSTDEGAHGTWKYTEMKFNTSLEAWVNPTDDANSEYSIFTKHTGYSNGGYAFVLSKINGTLRAAFYMQADNNGTTQDGRAGIRGAYSSVAVPLNTWTHVAVSFDTAGPDRDAGDPSVGRIRIYVNGEDVTTSDSSGNLMQPGSGETSIFSYSENSPWNESICYNGTWCASEFSVGGFYGWQNSFIGSIDEAKVWNVTKDAAYFSAYDPMAGPYISTVEGMIGSNQLTVTFSEGVYTNTGSSGALVVADFVITDTDNSRTITGVSHTAGSRTSVLTLSSALDDTDDILVDTLAPASNAIYDDQSVVATTNAVVYQMSTACPTSPVTFNLNEASGSGWIFDTQGMLAGQVFGSSTTLTGSEFSGGGDGSGRYLMFNYNPGCLQATTAMTLETRFKPTGIVGSANYIRRVLARDGGGNFQMSVWKNNGFTNYSAPDGVASIALWVRPADSHGGNVWKPVLTDYSSCPIVSDHWYQVKAVWDTNKAGGTPGAFFVPADIYVDDQGTDGAGTGELWSGYANCTNAAQSYIDDVQKLYTGDEIFPVSANFAIGANRNNPANNLFNGLIDWIIWEDAVNP